MGNEGVNGIVGMATRRACSLLTATKTTATAAVIGGMIRVRSSAMLKTATEMFAGPATLVLKSDCTPYGTATRRL